MKKICWALVFCLLLCTIVAPLMCTGCVIVGEPYMCAGCPECVSEKQTREPPGE